MITGAKLAVVMTEQGSVGVDCDQWVIANAASAVWLLPNDYCCCIQIQAQQLTRWRNWLRVT